MRGVPFTGGWRNVIGPVSPNERGRAEGDSKLQWSNSGAVTRRGYSAVDFVLSIEGEDNVPGRAIIPAEPHRGVVLIAHQTTEPETIGSAEAFGIKGDEQLAYGEELASEGFVVIGVDYPGFGSYQVDPYKLGYESVLAKAIWNHVCLANCVKKEWPAISSKVGIIGHSLGGTNAVMLSAYSSEPVAVVCSAGLGSFAEFAEYHGGSLERWSRSDKYMPKIADIYENNPANLDFDFGDLAERIYPAGIFFSAPIDDDIFPINSARKAVGQFIDYYLKNKSPDNVVVHFPDVSHRFPEIERKKSYAFLKRHILNAQ